MSRIAPSRRGLFGFLPALAVGRIDPTPIATLSPIVGMWRARPQGANVADADVVEVLYRHDEAMMRATPTSLLDLAIQARVCELGRYDHCRFARNRGLMPMQVEALARASGIQDVDGLRLIG